jgi:signal transduction histidine kinase
MRTGIRFKIGMLLIAAGVVPLVAALGLMVLEERRAQTTFLGQTQQSAVVIMATRLQYSFDTEIEKILLALQDDPHTQEATWLLAEPRLPLTATQRADIALLDQRWPDLPDDDELIVSLQDNDLAYHLRSLMVNTPEIAEILVTDSNGELLAMAGRDGRPSDYFQGDEEWWIQAYHGGEGRIFVPEVSFDESAAVWSLDICVPILADGHVAGIVKVVVALDAWVDSSGVFVGLAALGGGGEAEGMITDGTGIRIYETAQIDDEHFIGVLSATEQDAGPGWRQISADVIQAYAPVRFQRRIRGLDVLAPQWMLAVEVHHPLLLHHQNPVTWRVAAAGVGIIAVIYLTGLYLGDRSIGRRIRRLRSITQKVGTGDFTRELRSYRPHHLLGEDEIDELFIAYERMIENLRTSHEELHRANELKAQFIKVAGHELRTPISYIIALPKLMEGVTDIDKLHDGMRTMEAKARRLTDIIQSMFKLMEDQEFSESLNRQIVPLEDVLGDLYDDVMPFVEEREQTLQIDAGPSPSPKLYVDRNKICDALQNLVGNAIKFTPVGGTIRVTTTELADGRVAIAVTDEGPGISDEDLPNIFNPFYSTSDVMKHSSGSIGKTKHGMGLGLAVVKHFSEMHGGTVQMTSGPHGSTFTMILPIIADGDEYLEKD